MRTSNPIHSVHGMARLSRDDFEAIGQFIHRNLGIKMPAQKRGMVEARLRKRLKYLGLSSYSDYRQYLLSERGIEKELQYFIDAVTTNKTDFFREPRHFDYLAKYAVADLVQRKRKAHGRPCLTAWSAACSRGDEPYTMAMVLHDALAGYPGFDFTVMATDISMQMLKAGARGIYDHGVVEPVPPAFRKRYLLRSRDRNQDLVRVIPMLRKRVRFKQLNLIREFDFHTEFDIIFCRNVTIYFDPPTKARLMEKLCNRLKPGGYLFMGHSELLDHTCLPVEPVTSAIYIKTGSVDPQS